MSKINKLPTGKLELVEEISTSEPDKKSETTRLRLPIQEMEDMVKSNRHRIKYNQLILDGLPDIERSMTAITSLILAPNDLKNGNLTYRSESLLPTGLLNTLNEIVQTFIEEQYQLTEKQDTIVKEAMFTHGGYGLVTIPISNITYLQNRTIDGESGLEARSKPTNTPTASPYFNSTDDMRVLKSDTQSSGVEKMLDPIVKAKVNNKELIEKAFRQLYVLEVNDNIKYKYDSKISAISKKVPVDSIVPIYDPSSPENHAGYIILLDNSGNPLNLNVDTIDVSGIKSTEELFKTIDKKSSMDNSEIRTIKSMDEIYNTVVGNHLLTLVKNKTANEITDIDLPNDMRNLLFTRALKKQETKLLYVDKANLAYFAFDTRVNGTGRSILERIRTLASMRISLMVSRFAVNMKNSVTTTVVEINIDEDEIDPDGFIAETKSAVMSHGRRKTELGLLDPNDISAHLQSAGYIFKVTGPGIPEYKVDISEESPSYTEPEGVMEEDIQRLINLSFGLPAKIAEDGLSDTLATAILENKELLNQFIFSKQKVMNRGNSSHVKALVRNSPYIQDIFKETITKELSKIKRRLGLKNVPDNEVIDFIIADYVNNILVSLPTAEISEEIGSKDKFNNYKDFVEEAIELYLSDEALPSELVGELNVKVDDLSTAAKNTLMRNWMDENNFLPELSNLLVTGDDGKKHLPLIEEFYNYQKDMSEPLLALMKEMNKVKKKTNKKLLKIEESTGEEEEETPAPSTPDETPKETPEETPDEGKSTE